MASHLGPRYMVHYLRSDQLLGELSGAMKSRIVYQFFSGQTGQTTVNKKAPIHYIISIDDMVYRPL